MYTLYGHEGPTTTATFSPMGDFLLTGGADSNIVIWNSNLNDVRTEELYGISAAKVETDIFVTDKPEVKKLPQEKKKAKENNSKVKNTPHGTDVYPNATTSNHSRPPLTGGQLKQENTQVGPTYRQLKPEVKQTLDKIVYQLDVVKGALGLLEKRITNNESKLTNVMNFIREEDYVYVSTPIYPIKC